VVAAPIVLLLLTAAAGWVRVNVGFLPGLIATLAVVVAFAALWLRASMWMPSPDVPWTAFLPGAVVFGLGLEALHLFTAYFLEAKLSSASELYGVLGLATTALFYLFLLGRGVVWAAELNAVVWEVRSGRGR
jgi:membrane protein